MNSSECVSPGPKRNYFRRLSGIQFRQCPPSGTSEVQPGWSLRLWQLGGTLSADSESMVKILA